MVGLLTAGCRVPPTAGPRGAYPAFLDGVVVPMVTPFQADRRLDEAGLRAFTAWLCARPVSALFPLGGSGEYETLTLEERRRVIDIVIAVAGGRVAVIPGVGAAALEDTLALARYAEQRGVDGVTVVVPAAAEGDEEPVVQYLAAVAHAVTVPVILYDARGTVTPALMRRLGTLPRIAGIKFRSPDVRAAMRVVEAAQGRVAVMAGIETYFLPTLAVGGAGVVGGGGNLYPGLLREVRARFERGDWRGALVAQLAVDDAQRVLKRGEWPLSGKVVLAELGVPIHPVTRGDEPPIAAEDARVMGEYFRRLDAAYR